MNFEFLDKKYWLNAEIKDDGCLFLREGHTDRLWLEPDEALKLLALLKKHEALLQEKSNGL